MSEIAIRGLLRLYPRAWRARYGEELAGLIVQASGSRGSSVRVTANVALAGLRERLRAIGLLGSDLTPQDRAQSGVLLVLWSWMLFVLGGIGIAKASEHWKAAVPAGSVRLPEVAFAVLLVGAALGSLFVLGGVVLAGQTLLPLLGAGGWRRIRRPIYRAAALTALAMVGLVMLSVWAHHLTDAQRNGHDGAYSGVILLWALLFAACLFSWVAAAAATVRQFRLTPRLLTLVTYLATLVATAMTVMTAASAIWWGAIAEHAPWFFAGSAPGTPGSVAPMNVVVPVGLMLVATLLAALGARRSLANVRLAEGMSRRS